MTTKGSPAIICEDVKKWFGNFQALSGVTTSVGWGEVVVVIGPSGSGKSTFIRCINRLEAHQAGRIVVDGMELTNDLRNIDAIRREVGMVFQQFNLFPHLTVLQNITLAPIWARNRTRSDSEAAAMKLPAPGLAMAHELYVSLQAQGLGRKGTQSLILALARLAGLEWEPSRAEG